MSALVPVSPFLPAAAELPSQRHLAEAWRLDMVARVKAGELSDRTAGGYQSAVQAWLIWLDCRGINAPSPADVLAYAGELRDRLKPGTVGTYLAGLRGFYTWTEARNLYPAIARSIRGPKSKQGGPLDCLDRADVAGLLDLVDGKSLAALRDRALIHVMFSTALRLVSLTGANVQDLADGGLAYQGKGDREKARRAFPSASALEALDSYLAARQKQEGPLSPSAPLFAAVGNRAGGRRLSSRSIRRIVTDLMERAGHVRRDGAGRIARPGVLSAHSLRRSGITAAANLAGIDAAQTLAGHQRRETTERFYARVEQGRVLRELAKSLDLGARV